MKIKDWKLFEGYYDDMIQSIKKLKDTYREQVMETLYEVLDDYYYEVNEDKVNNDIEVNIKLKLKEFETIIKDLSETKTKYLVGKDIYLTVIKIDIDSSYYKTLYADNYGYIISDDKIEESIKMMLKYLYSSAKVNYCVEKIEDSNNDLLITIKI